MRSLRCTAIAAALVVGAAQSATAAVLIDTGAGNPGWGGVTIADSQWLAGRISLAETVTVQGVELWVSATGPVTLTARLFSNSNADMPGAELHSAAFSFDTQYGDGNNWQGAFGLNWVVDPGDYWLVFRGTGAPSDHNAFAHFTAPNPLAAYAFSHDMGASWTPDPWDPLSVRVTGELGGSSTPVPEPASPALLGMGIIGIGLRRRRGGA